jgi:hypothetical protein
MRLLTIETESRLGTLWDQEQCNQFCSKEELWEAVRDAEMKMEEQYQERFWRQRLERLDGIGLDTATKEFLAIEFKRPQDARNVYVERATAVAQEQYKSLITGLQAVDQVKGWKVQQMVFVGGTCGSIHVESFNRNLKALGVLESKWDPIRKKLARRLLEAYFAQKGGARSKGGDRGNCKGREHVQGTCMREEGARRPWPSDQILIKWGAWKLCCIIFSGFVKFVKFVVSEVVMLGVHSGGRSEEVR